MSPSFPPGLNPAPSINRTLRQHLGSIVSAALAGVDARRSTARRLHELDESLAGEPRVRVAALGKAAAAMALAADEALGRSIVAGIVTAEAAAFESVANPARWRARPGSHPRPSAASEAAGRAALGLADDNARDDGLLLVCLSGGASAIAAVPAPGLTIEDKAAASDVLLAAGLDIGELNLIRRHLSAIKGGQLAARAGRSMTFAISDVCTPVEDDPAVIGSGPTAGDDSTFADALEVITRRGLQAALPPAIVARLEAGVAGRPMSSPIPSGDIRLRRAAYWIVASRHDAMRAAADAASRLGYATHIVRSPTIGAAADAARTFVARAIESPRPACVIASGETTVHVTGGGRGGRNQEFAVAALALVGRAGPAALASVGTDGRDGPTDAAGAFVDDEMWRALGERAAERCDAALRANDTYPLLDEAGALVRTGLTGTNVGDVQVLLLPARV